MATNTSGILADVLAALKAIRKSGGFQTDVALVTESTIGFEQAGAFPALSVRVLRERALYFPARSRRRLMRLQVTGLVRAPVGTDKFMLARALMADVDRALMADPSRNGLAAFTEVREWRYDAAPQEEGARAACVAEIALHESV